MQHSTNCLLTACLYASPHASEISGTGPSLKAYSRMITAACMQRFYLFIFVLCIKQIESVYTCGRIGLKTMCVDKVHLDHEATGEWVSAQ